MVDVHLPTDRETGRPRGFAFVEFSQAGEAADAISKFNNREVGGRRLNVNAADDRPRRVGTGMPFRPSPSPSHAMRGSVPSNDAAPSQDELGYGGSRTFKNKGSRRNLRARKRSLNF